MRNYLLLFIIIGNLNAEIAWVDDSTLYEKVKATTKEWISPKVLTLKEKKAEHQNRVWEKVFDDLGEGVENINLLEKAPKKSWIGSDKSDIQENIDAILERLIESLTDDKLFAYREKIEKLKRKVQKNRETVLLYREKKIGAPKSSMIYTTKEGFNHKIEKLYVENKIYENDIRMAKEELKQNFLGIGVVLSYSQIDVLLSRIDGEDIIQISLVMDILKEITSQIVTLMKESKQEVFYAKKYYGMHVISLKLVVYIQQQYIDKVKKKYLPKIEVLITTAQNMMDETKKLKAKEEDYRRVSIYAKNLEAQQLAYKASIRYKNDLITSLNTMLLAQQKSKDDLTLSENTYKTVTLSSELYTLMVESQENFSEITKIQMPYIIPFENKAMQTKYKELTNLMKEK